jgi:hypothetical protein
MTEMETAKAFHLGASELEHELRGLPATSRELKSMFYANDEIGTVHADPPLLNSWRITQLHVESVPRTGSYTRRKLIVTYLSAPQILYRVLHELVDPKTHEAHCHPRASVASSRIQPLQMLQQQQQLNAGSSPTPYCISPCQWT